MIPYMGSRVFLDARSLLILFSYKTLSYRIGVDREIPPEGSLNQVKPEACRGFYLI